MEMSSDEVMIDTNKEKCHSLAENHSINNEEDLTEDFAKILRLFNVAPKQSL